MALQAHAHFAQKAGQSDTNIRWHALQNSEAKTKSRSSVSDAFTLCHFSDTIKTLPGCIYDPHDHVRVHCHLAPSNQAMGRSQGPCRHHQLQGETHLGTNVAIIHARSQITKLYLYNNEHALALSHHNLHMRRFADFSRGWGIGEETFEYWSWMSRQ